MREQALQCAYESIQHRAGGTFAQLCAAVADWHVIPIENEGAIIIGAVLINGSELHIALQPSAQNKTWLRGLIRKHVQDVIDQHGIATTKVMQDHAIGHRLARLIGFKQVATNNGITEYQCTEVAL